MASTTGVLPGLYRGVRGATRIIRVARSLPLFPLILLGSVVIAGIFAPFIAAQGTNETDLNLRNRPPFWVDPPTKDKIVTAGVLKKAVIVVLDGDTEIVSLTAQSLTRLGLAVAVVEEKRVVEGTTKRIVEMLRLKDPETEIERSRATLLFQRGRLMIEGLDGRTARLVEDPDREILLEHAKALKDSGRLTGEVAIGGIVKISGGKVKVVQNEQNEILLETALARKDAGLLVGDVAIGNTVIEVTGPGGSVKYPLGTDQLGRDLLSRMIHGARITLLCGVVALASGGLIGVGLGLLAGYYGKWVDEIIMRLADIQLAFPLILIALVAVLAFGQSFGLILVILAMWIWARFARMARAEVLKLKTMDYVSLARVAGASTPRILLVHILPGMMNTLVVIATLEVGAVILIEALLSFLGAGVPPPTPAWGTMVSDGRPYLATAWWVSTMPGICILLTVLPLNLLGDWLRDKLDPKLRQQI